MGLLRVAGSLALALACCAAGCDAEGDGSEPPGATSGPTATCPAGQARATGVDGSERCAPALAGACAPGTMPRLGSDACEPVGWHDCPAGFVTDPSGWGCADVLPAEPCQGATRDALGNAACVPIGDCDAPFPPADADLHVDAAFAGDGDPTHFVTIAAALAAAGPGESIAVASGTYAEKVVIAEDVTLVGRCAAEVVIVAPPTSAPAVALLPGAAASVRGVTVRGGSPAFRVPSGASLVLEDALVDGAGNEGLRVPGGTVTVVRSVVRATAPSTPGSQTIGVMAYDGAEVTIRESALSDNIEAGVGIIDAGTELTVEDSVIRGTRAQPNGEGGIGAKAYDGSRLVIRRSALVANRQVQVLVGGPGTSAEVTASVARDLVMDDQFAAGFAWGVSVSRGAQLDLTDFALVRTPVIGLAVDDDSALRGTRVVVRDGQGSGWMGMGMAGYAGKGGQLSLADSALVGNTGADLFSEGAGSLVRLDRVLMDGTLPVAASPQGPAGRGGVAVGALHGGRAELVDCAITRGAEVGIEALHAGTSVDALRVLVSGVRPTQQDHFGHGLLARDGAAATVEGCWFRDNDGVALAFAAATGTVRGTWLSQNAIGVHVQGGSTLREADLQSALPAGALEVVLAPDTVLWDNEERIAGGALPLPDPLVEVPDM